MADYAQVEAEQPPTPKVPFFLILFALGLLGILSLLFQPLPLPDDLELPFSDSVIGLLVLIQPTILLLVAVLVGVNTAPRVGLHAPAIEAAVRGESPLPALRGQLVPALLVGAVASVVLALYGWYQTVTLPEAAAAGAETNLLVRVLYGGITEELLLRWGMMSFLIWLGWRIVQRREGAARPAIVWAGNIVAALLFGLGHLPAAFMSGLTGPVWIVLVVGLNALLGVLFGWLFWRKGLEATIIAHAFTHVVAVLVFFPLLV